MPKDNKKTIYSTLNLLLLFVIVFALIYYLSLGNSNPGVVVRFLSVGQGDAELIQDTNGNSILIDGGPDNTVVSELDKYISFYERKIDAIILTHPHADHVNGLVDVVEKYKVGHFYLTGVVHTAPEYIKLLNLLKEKNIPTSNVVMGDSLKLSDGARLDILYPTKKLVGQSVDNLNNTSVVARLIYGKESVLFMGDLENTGQEDLLKQGTDLASNIYKVSHHGSKYATNLAFMRQVKPRYAVVEVGKDNLFGHPHKGAIDMLSSFGAQIFRTDADGDISFALQKNSVKILK